MLRVAHRNSVEVYKHVHIAANRLAKAAASVKRLKHERVVQQMELLILDAQIAQLTGYVELKQGGFDAGPAAGRKSLAKAVVAGDAVRTRV